jgi:hypothetical protein
MDIGKIEKARRYTEQPDRITFQSLSAEFRGDSGTYIVTLDDNGWHCTCHGYEARNMCPHIMTLERILTPMVKRPLQPYKDGQQHIGDVEKSILYAAEKHRITFITFGAIFSGDNSEHRTLYNIDGWDCDCATFRREGTCPHTIALERVLGEMLPAAARHA